MRLPTHLRGERSEAGETLLEVLIATTLMAIVIVAIVGGLGTMLIGARVHRQQTDANTALVDAMELLKSTTVSRVCAANNPSHPYLTVSGLDSHVSIGSIEYETISSAGGSPSVVWSSALSDCSLTNTLSLQRITLSYTSSDNKVAPTLSFIKGDV